MAPHKLDVIFDRRWSYLTSLRFKRGNAVFLPGNLGHATCDSRPCAISTFEDIIIYHLNSHLNGLFHNLEIYTVENSQLS